MFRFLINFFIFFSSVEAFAARRPVTCYFDTSINTVQRSCREFIPGIHRSQAGVCMFHSGTGGWQRGIMEWDDSLSKHVFSVKNNCLGGVEAIEIMSSGTLKGPFSRGTKVALATGNIFNSSFTQAEMDAMISGNNRTTQCVRKRRGRWGTSMRPCSNDPNGVGFCHYLDLTSGKYRGNWWVMYTSPNQRDPEVCRGGVVVQDIQSVVTDSGVPTEIFDYEKLDEATYLASYTAPFAAEDDDSDAIACIHDNGKNLKRYGCQTGVEVYLTTDTYKIRRGRCYARQVGAGFEVYRAFRNSKTWAGAGTRRCAFIERNPTRSLDP